MAVPMRSTDFRSIVEPILSEEFDGVYDQRADEWKGVFREQTGTPRSYHEEPVLFGFGAAPELPDGTAVTYQSGGVLFIKRYVYKVYGLAFALTKVLVEDGDHIRIGQIYARHLAQSLIETNETLAAQIINRAYNGSLGGDGVALGSASHPIANGGVRLGTLIVAYDKSLLRQRFSLLLTRALWITLRISASSSTMRILVAPAIFCSNSSGTGI